MADIQKKCPMCGTAPMQKIEPPIGDYFFIASYVSSTKHIIDNRGILFDAYMCPNCNNIQLFGRQ